MERERERERERRVKKRERERGRGRQISGRLGGCQLLFLPFAFFQSNPNLLGTRRPPLFLFDALLQQILISITPFTLFVSLSLSVSLSFTHAHTLSGILSLSHSLSLFSNRLFNTMVWFYVSHLGAIDRPQLRLKIAAFVNFSFF